MIVKKEHLDRVFYMEQGAEAKLAYRYKYIFFVSLCVNELSHL